MEVSWGADKGFIFNDFISSYATTLRFKKKRHIVPNFPTFSTNPASALFGWPLAGPSIGPNFFGTAAARNQLTNASVAPLPSATFLFPPVSEVTENLSTARKFAQQTPLFLNPLDFIPQLTAKNSVSTPNISMMIPHQHALTTTATGAVIRNSIFNEDLKPPIG